MFIAFIYYFAHMTNKYSKGIFKHQSLRVEEKTLNRLREHCRKHNNFYARFAADAINKAIDEAEGVVLQRNKL